MIKMFLAALMFCLNLLSHRLVRLVILQTSSVEVASLDNLPHERPLSWENVSLFMFRAIINIL